MVIEKFNLDVATETETNREDYSFSGQYKTSWTRNEIVQLISLYKELKTKFQSTTIRNDKVWQEISVQIGTHSWEQCKNKFKYLKSKYVEKKDNMGTKASGAKNMKFEYFEEMDEVFQNDPNIKPIALASSSKGIENMHCLKINEDKNQEKKRKADNDLQEQENRKTKKGIPMDIYKEVQEMKEHGRNKRHQEIVQVLNNFVSALKDLVPKKI